MSQVHSPTLPISYKLHDMYTIKAVLGQGGFGITYLAVEDMTDFPVVIKENYPEQLADRNLHTHEEQTTVVVEPTLTPQQIASKRL